MVSAFDRDGYIVLGPDERVAAWSKAAHQVALHRAQDEALRKTWLRHQGTWFVGVDALPNARDGAIGGVPLTGPWAPFIKAPETWHAAQLSVVYPGYPKQDPDESDANHRFRINRCAAHVDGILLENGRRFLREPHAFVLGLPLNSSEACPLVVWPGSHLLMGAALKEVLQEDPQADITEVYKTARASVFAKIDPVQVSADPGQAVLLHRHLLHGIAPWKTGDTAPPEGRMVAYFRPQMDRLEDWAV
ncbi:MAG: hypothetical protein AAF891_07895 [Pseudomonadota bacterium]